MELLINYAENGRELKITVILRYWTCYIILESVTSDFATLRVRIVARICVLLQAVSVPKRVCLIPIDLGNGY